MNVSQIPSKTFVILFLGPKRNHVFFARPKEKKIKITKENLKPLIQNKAFYCNKDE